MKHTSASTLSTGTYSTAGYTLVYSGSFPNNSSSGWMEVELDTRFEYNGVAKYLSSLDLHDCQQPGTAIP